VRTTVATDSIAVLPDDEGLLTPPQVHESGVVNSCKT